MSFAIGILLFTLVSFADPKEKNQLPKNISQIEKVREVVEELGKVIQFTKRTDLTVREWIAYVDSVEAKCAQQSAEGKFQKRGLCSLFFDLNEITIVFRENPNGPTADQCNRYIHSASGHTSRAYLNPILKTIAGKLCPK